jgi:hypothetical protein
MITDPANYRSPKGEAEVLTLYDEALAALGHRHESLTVETRYGDTHVLVIGPEDDSPVVFLPGGNFLNPTCLRWFLPLSERHRLYAPDLVGQPGKSAQARPSPKGDGHAFWMEDVLDGLGLVDPVPLMGLSYGAGDANLARGHCRRPDLAGARRGGSAHAPLSSQVHGGAPVARGEAHTHGARGSCRPLARGGLQTRPAGRRPAPDGHQGGATGLRRSGCGVRLRAGRVISRPLGPPTGTGDLP